MQSCPRRPKRQRNRGFGIIVVLGFAAVLAVFTAGIGAQTADSLHDVSRHGQTDQAYYAAFTGVQVTIGFLYEPPTNFDLTGDGIPDNWLEVDRSVRFRLNDHAEAAAHLYHNIQGFEGSRDVADDGTIIPPDHFYITSIGEVNGEYDADGELIGGVRVSQNTMGSLISPDFPVTPFALFGFSSVNVNGNIDHFDSRDFPGGGPFQTRAQMEGFADHMECPWPDASIATSQTSSTAITLGPEARIDGHAVLGFGSGSSDMDAVAAQAPVTTPPLVEPDPIPTFGPPLTWGGGNADNDKLTGLVSRLGVDKTPRMVELPDTVSPLGSNLNITYTLELAEGTNYQVLGDFAVGAGGRVVVEDTDLDGTVKDSIIFVEGNISFTGTTGINDNCAPRQLKLFSLGTGGASTNFTMVGSRAHCLVAGNNLNATLDATSELWGAVMGTTITLERGTIHFDTALRDPRVLASIYGYGILSNVAAQNSGVALNFLAPPAGPGTTGTTGGTDGGGLTGTVGTGTSGTGTSGTGTSGTGTSGTGTSGTGTSGTGTSGTGTSGTGTSGTGTSGTGTSGTGTSGTGTSGTGTSGTGTSGTTTTGGCGGCGCGCGGGSMMMMEK